MAARAVNVAANKFAYYLTPKRATIYQVALFVLNIAGFSTITFYAYGRSIPVHGFLQREVREMKRLVEERGKLPSDV